MREATSADIEILVRHRRMMWWDMGRRDPHALEVMEKAAAEYFAEAIPSGAYHGFLVTTADGKVVGGGGVVISPWPGILGQSQPKRAMILNMYVEREYRRQGIARSLMSRMIAWCRESGFRSVGLHASDEGRPLYQSLGFKPTNEMRLDL